MSTEPKLSRGTGVQKVWRVSDPVPRLRIVDCPDRAAWGRLLWELNQADEGGRSQYTVLLHRPQDVARLQLAIFQKITAQLNSASRVSILNFIPGRILEIPQVRPDHHHMVDAEIARYFFHSVHFYAQSIQEIEKALLELDQELRKPEMRAILDGVELPPLREKR